MTTDLYDDAIVDVVGPDTVLSTTYTVKVRACAVILLLVLLTRTQDVYLREATPKQLDFVSPFSLTCTADRKTKIHFFVLYFDVFFTVTGDRVPAHTQAHIIRPDEASLAEVWPVGGKKPPQRRKSQSENREKVVSFSTGPQSEPTHWKQTLFLLRDPIIVEEGAFRLLYCTAS